MAQVDRYFASHVEVEGCITVAESEVDADAVFFSCFCREGINFSVVLEVHTFGHFFIVDGELRDALALETESDLFVLLGAEYGFVTGGEVGEVDACRKGGGTRGDEVERGADLGGDIGFAFLFGVVPVLGTEALLAVYATLLEYALQGDVGSEIAPRFIDEL